MKQAIVHIERKGRATVECGLRDDQVQLSRRDEANAQLHASLLKGRVCERCRTVVRARETSP
jgi:hypothetical protein